MSVETELRRIVAATQVEQRLPSISAAAFRDGEPLWQEALGLADVEPPPVKLYVATYPVTRAPLAFGADADATPRSS